MGPDVQATGELREFEAFTPIIALGSSMNLDLGIATGEEPSPWPDAAAQAIDRAYFARGPCPLRAPWHHLDGDDGWQSLDAGDPARAAGRGRADRVGQGALPLCS